MTVTAANVTVDVDVRTELPTDGYAIYCRQGDHARCSLVCACPHHDEPQGTVWTSVPLAERLQLIDGGEQ